MKLRTLLLSVAVALPLSLSAAATAAPTPPKPPPLKFPMQTEPFRKLVDLLISHATEVCDKHCDGPARAKLSSAVSKTRSRTLDACSDGIVTDAEADWVLAPLNEELD